MGWNYRVIRRSHLRPDGGFEHTFGIHEVFYNEDKSIKSWSENAVRVDTDEQGELLEMLSRMRLALDKPVLDEVEYVGNGKVESRLEELTDEEHFPGGID